MDEQMDPIGGAFNHSKGSGAASCKWICSGKIGNKTCSIANAAGVQSLTNGYSTSISIHKTLFKGVSSNVCMLQLPK
jgi:hypothetical protein